MLAKMINLSIVLTMLIFLNSESISGADAFDYNEQLQKAIVMFEENNLSEAEKLFNSALKVNTKGSEAFYYLALIYAVYAENIEDIENERKQLVNKACQYLEYAVSAGFRDHQRITKENSFTMLLNSKQFSEVMKTLEYLILKELKWESAITLKYQIDLPNKIEPNKKYPLMLLLKPYGKYGGSKFQPDYIASRNGFACGMLEYANDDNDITKGYWTEFMEKRIRKTLKEIKEKLEKRENIDFSRVYLCGIWQGGYRALFTYLTFPDAFAGAITFNAAVLEGSDVFKLLKNHKDKKNLRIIAVHSKKDVLGFNSSEKAWQKLIKSGVPVDYMVENEIITGKKDIEKYEKSIAKLVNKEQPEPEKTDKPEQPQTKPK